MKKKSLLALIIFGAIAIPSLSYAEVIDSFRADINIKKDSGIDVIERIDYDFESAFKHGIFRDIPIKYKARGGNYNLRISNISVEDNMGKPHQFTTSYPGNDIQLRIGDPNATITGKHTYVIRYQIQRAINYLEKQDELYWNVTGNSWPVVIKQASAKVSFPPNLKKNNGINPGCFIGAYGSAEDCKLVGVVADNSTSFLSPRQLNPGEGLSIVVGLPKEMLTRPSVFQNIRYLLQDNWIFSLPFLTFFILFYIWYTRGRDPEGRGTIIAEFGPPDDLSPTAVGTIIDERVGNRDISAEIINLAVKGYIKITRIKEEGIVFDDEDYLFEKLKSEETIQNNFEKNFMKNLFTADLEELSKVKITGEASNLVVGKSMSNQWMKLSQLKNRFYKSLKGLKDSVYDDLTNQGYFVANPGKVRTFFLAIGGAISLSVIFFLGRYLDFYTSLNLVISGGLTAFASLVMPARTKKGALAKEQILGLKEYMSVAEKDRIKFHNAPEKNPEYFDKLLPYAMVLGVEKEWAKQFEGLYNQNPGWYADATGQNFNFIVFTSNLTSFSASANSVLTSIPAGASSGGSGFGGGGFSGGGFGGGGGGSW